MSIVIYYFNFDKHAGHDLSIWQYRNNDKGIMNLHTEKKD